MSGTVLVVGSLHYDVVVNAPHLPQLDETLPGSGVRYIAGGKGGNQAVAAARNGANVAFGGLVGDDAPGAFLKAHLFAAGCDLKNLGTRKGEATGMSVAIVTAHGDYAAVIVSGANLSIHADEIEFPEATRCIVLQNEIPEAVNLALMARARAAGIKVILNAAPAREMGADLLAMVDLLIVNRVEAGMITGLPVMTRQEALSTAAALTHLVNEVILTLGDDGCIHAVKDGRAIHEPALRAEVVSTHGAGDAFVGALVSQLVDGSEMDAAIHYAQAAAALHVSTAIEQRHLIRPMHVRNRLGED